MPKLFRQSPTYGTFCIEFDVEDVRIVLSRPWCLKKDGNRWYARVHGEGLHRAIMQPQPGEYVDHIDGNGLNNRRSNLRVCTHAQNMRNSPPSTRNKSGFKGVSWYKPGNKWRVRISVDGKERHIGYFTDFQEAVAAYVAAAEKYHREFAWFLRDDVG